MSQTIDTDSIGYLLVQVCRAHRNKAQDLLGRIDLYPGQEFLLSNLTPEDGLTHTQLADNLCVQPATVTRMLQRMERNGLVESRPDEIDQRVSRVYLTGQGRQLLHPIEQTWQALEGFSLANLSPEEIHQLRCLLHKIYQNLIGIG